MTEKIDWKEVKREEDKFFAKIAAEMLGEEVKSITREFLAQRAQKDVETAKKKRAGSMEPLSLDDMRVRLDQNLKTISERPKYASPRK